MFHVFLLSLLYLSPTRIYMWWSVSFTGIPIKSQVALCILFEYNPYHHKNNYPLQDPSKNWLRTSISIFVSFKYHGKLSNSIYSFLKNNVYETPLVLKDNSLFFTCLHCPLKFKLLIFQYIFLFHSFILC